MPSSLKKKFYTRKSSDNIDGKSINHIGTFPKYMSKSWPAITGLDFTETDTNIDNNNSSCAVNNIESSDDGTEGNVSWLSRVLSRFGIGGNAGDHQSSESDNENYPSTFPFKRLAKEEKICLFSNNLYLEDRFDKLNHLSILRLTKNIFHSQGDGISNLPLSFRKLGSTLKELDLRDNPLQEIPDVIFHLSKLEILNLASCEITVIPNGIGNLKLLKKLYLDNNQITSPKHLSLPALEHLYLENNGVTDISHIQLMKLSMIDLSDNFIEKLPKEFLQNCVLKRLLLRGNSLKELPDSLCSVSPLRRLDVSKNLLKKLPEDIGNLSCLKYLNISWNDLTALPESIVNLRELRKEQFFCGENPLQKPPYEVAVKGHQSIEAYFKALNSGSSSNKRLKLMVLGNEKSGKTTLSKAIHLYLEPDYEEERTIGMDFFQWKAEAKEDGLQVLLVDCAGQKKYILTHQLFMATGLLFAVVVNLKTYTSSKYEQHIGEWIDLVLARVPKSVIIIVPTHIDLCDDKEIKEKCDNILENVLKRMNEIRKENEKDIRGSRSSGDETPYLPTHYMLSENGENKVYPESVPQETENEAGKKEQIFMIPVSNRKHLEGLTLLREEIIRIAYNQKLCPNINHILPETWVRLEQLCSEEQQFRKTISVDELYARSSKFFETRDDMIKALQYIDSIGPILYFHSIENIRDVVFLDPKWLSAAFKLIFRHDSDEFFTYKDVYEKIYDFPKEFERDKQNLLNTAVLSLKFLKCIWYDDFRDEKYFHQVITLLKNFDLAIDVELPSLPSDQQYMLVPWFLKDKCYCPNAVKCLKSSITCNVQTKGVLPDGFFQRFIVKVYSMRLFMDCFPWDCGFVGITQDYHIKCIHETLGNQSYITIEGHSSEKFVYHLWEIIIPLLMTIKDFIKEWEGIKYKTYSICPTCYEKKAKTPQFWQLNLDELYDNQDAISCRLECRTVDKWLIFPPPSIVILLLRPQQFDGKLSKQLTGEEKDLISGVIGHRCEELRKVLGVHEGQLERVHSQTNWRDRVIQIISLWEQKSKDEPCVRMFIECVHKMKPFPHDITEICLPSVTSPSVAT